ncbi:hypothetical protein J6590_074090 [Homalodisca vitripennis]|nr:hypothetical protein J6590_074090 [Homalodisca vitripennis]
MLFTKVTSGAQHDRYRSVQFGYSVEIEITDTRMPGDFHFTYQHNRTATPLEIRHDLKEHAGHICYQIGITHRYTDARLESHTDTRMPGDFHFTYQHNRKATPLEIHHDLKDHAGHICYQIGITHRYTDARLESHTDTRMPGDFHFTYQHNRTATPLEIRHDLKDHAGHICYQIGITHRYTDASMLVTSVIKLESHTDTRMPGDFHFTYQHNRKATPLEIHHDLKDHADTRMPGDFHFTYQHNRKATPLEIHHDLKDHADTRMPGDFHFTYQHNRKATPLEIHHDLKDHADTRMPGDFHFTYQHNRKATPLEIHHDLKDHADTRMPGDFHFTYQHNRKATPLEIHHDLKEHACHVHYKIETCRRYRDTR